jgi:hypothetical protein
MTVPLQGCFIARVNFTELLFHCDGLVGTLFFAIDEGRKENKDTKKNWKEKEEREREKKRKRERKKGKIEGKKEKT